MELTKEYFDQALTNLGVRIDERFLKIDDRFGKIDDRFGKIDDRFGKIDDRFDKIDDRFDKIERKIDAQTAELKQYVHESFETQQVFIAETLNEHKLPGLEARVTKVELEVGKLKLHRHAAD